MTSHPHKLPLKEKLGYSLGDTASNIFFQFVNIFLLYYYTDVFGISPGHAGTLFLVARVWDAFNDPLMGAIADRTRTRWGTYRPYLLWMAIPFGALGYLAFANPSLGETGRIVYAYVTYIGLMMAYTAINVPYSALMGVMTPSSAERTSLSTFRFVGAFSGGLIVSLGVRPLVRLLGGENEALGFKLTMAIFATVAIVMFFLTFAMTRERVKPQLGTSRIRDDIKILLKNKPWVIMVVAAILTLSSAAVRWTITPHYFKYYVGDDGSRFWWFLDKTTFVLTTGSLAFIAGCLFTGFVSRRFGKRNALMGLTILNGLLILSFYFLPPHAFTAMVVLNLIGNLVAGPTPALVWSIYTDVADYGEWKFGRRTTGLAFSAAMFAQKLGITIGGSICGWTLGGLGFVANTQQSPEVLEGIRAIFSILPGTLAIANGVVLIWYRLSESELKIIERDLAERRQEGVA